MISKIVDKKIGQRAGPSHSDLKQLQNLYMCTHQHHVITPDKNFFWNSDCPCWEGKENCNSDIDCRGNLIC